MPAECGVGSDRGPILRARFGDLGPRRHVILEILLQVLVVDVELFFESVQLRLVEDLPPIAADHGVLRVGHLPAFGVVEVDGGLFVIRRGDSGRRGRVISRPHMATGKKSGCRAGKFFPPWHSGESR